MISPARTRRLVGAAAAAVLAFSTVATAATAAHAGAHKLKDGKGDTYNISTAKKAPGHPVVDLRKVTIKHTARKLVVIGHTQDLKKVGNAVVLSVEVDTPTDASYSTAVVGEKGSWDGEASFYASDGTPCSPQGKLDYRKDLMRLSVPTSCLGRPAWVRLQIAGVHVKSDKGFIDSAHDGKFDLRWTRRIPRG